MPKEVTITLTVNECVGHKNWAYGRGAGSSFRVALCNAIKSAMKHQNFRGKRIKSGKIGFQLVEKSTAPIETL
jgi:hypothetical protein